MIFIKSDSSDPYFNLACEEFLLKQSREDFLFVYINNPSVIVGKHQNLYAEVNSDYTGQEGIILARRLSGGGAVYHDQGNLNFAFIETGTAGHLSGQKKYTEIIVSALKNAGIDAEAGKRNDIWLGGKKISGCAEHVHKDRVLHHGTLLFNADLDKLNRVLRAHPGVSDKAVKSVRSEVTNISMHPGAPVSMDSLIINIRSGLTGSLIQRELNVDEQTAINSLAKEKYSSWNWIVGGSPACTIDRILLGNLHVIAHIEKGIIINIEFESQFIAATDLNHLHDALTGVRLHKKEIASLLRPFDSFIDIPVLLSALF